MGAAARPPEGGPPPPALTNQVTAASSKSLRYSDLSGAGALSTSIEIPDCATGNSAIVSVYLHRQVDYLDPESVLMAQSASVSLPLLVSKPWTPTLQLPGPPLPGRYHLAVWCGFSDTGGERLSAEFTVPGEAAPVAPGLGPNVSAVTLDPIPPTVRANTDLLVGGAGCQRGTADLVLETYLGRRARETARSTGTSPANFPKAFATSRSAAQAKTEQPWLPAPAHRSRSPVDVAVGSGWSLPGEGATERAPELKKVLITAR